MGRWSYSGIAGSWEEKNSCGSSAGSDTRLSTRNAQHVLGRDRNRFAEGFVTANFFAAAFIDSYFRLTDIAVRQNFPMQVAISVANVATGTARGCGEAGMPLADRSITILTGMIIATLYVILLVGFSQESYMRRDAMRRIAAPDWRSEEVAVWPVIHDVSKRVCRIEPPICAAPSPDASARRSCLSPIDGLRRFATEPVIPLTLEGFRHAMRDDP